MSAEVPVAAPLAAGPTRARRLLAWTNVVLMSAFLLGLLVVLNVLAAEHPKRWDLTANRMWEISDHSRKVVKNLRSDFTIYSTPMFEGPFGSDRSLPQAWDQVHKMLGELAVLNPKLKVVRRAEDTQEGLQEFLQDFPTPSANWVYFATTGTGGLRQKKAVNVYEMFQGNPQNGEISEFRAEAKVISTIVALTSEKRAKIYFTLGHRELVPVARDQRGLGMSMVTTKMGELENAEFTALELLKEKAVPKDADALVIAAPRMDFEVPEIDALREYWKGGGRILVTWEPFLPTPLPALQAFLEDLGVRINRDIVFDRQSAYSDLRIHKIQRFGDHPINQGMQGAQFRMISTCSLDLAPKRPGMNAGVLMQAPATAWADANYQPGLVPSPDMGEKQAEIALAVALEEKAEKPRNPASKTGRLVVWGGTTSMTDMGLGMMFGMNLPDLEYVLNTYRWLLEREQVIADPIAPKSIIMRPLKLPDGALRYIGWTSVVILPLVGVLLGISAWFFRRK